jgi:molecular chaperone GrpE
MKKADPEIEKVDSRAEPSENSAAAEPLVPVEPATINAEQLEELKSRAATADEHWRRLLHTAADFDNFKKRAAREKQDAIKYANENLIEKLLPILDSLDMAAAAAQNGSANAAQSLQAGISMVHQQLKSVLEEAGLEEVDATGRSFDPNLHEAISQRESVETPDGHVLQQVRKGYKLRGRLLRPASVVVAKAPEEMPENSK